MQNKRWKGLRRVLSVHTTGSGILNCGISGIQTQSPNGNYQGGVGGGLPMLGQDRVQLHCRKGREINPLYFTFCINGWQRSPDLLQGHSQVDVDLIRNLIKNATLILEI